MKACCVQDLYFIKRKNKILNCNLQNVYMNSMFFNEMPGLTSHHVIVDKENNISFFGFISIKMDIRRTTLRCKNVIFAPYMYVEVDLIKVE